MRDVQEGEGFRYKKKRSSNRSAKNPRVDARSRRALVSAQVPAPKKRKVRKLGKKVPLGEDMDVDSSDSDSDAELGAATSAAPAAPAAPATPAAPAKHNKHNKHNEPATPATPAEPPAQSTCCNNCDYIFNNLLKLQLDSAKCSVYEPKKDSGYTGLPHAKMCLHGEECTNNEFDVEVPLHACYFCPASECARCAGLSIRQVRLKNPLDFVCSQCVDEARKNARVFVG